MTAEGRRPGETIVQLRKFIVSAEVAIGYWTV